VAPVYVVVRLWVQEGNQPKFEAYERKVSRIMARYGGVIERAVRRTEAVSPESDPPFEVHVLRFPSRELYDAYRGDAERRALAAERTDVITSTDVLVGEEGPRYAE